MEPSEAVSVPYRVDHKQKIISPLKKSLEHLPKEPDDEEHKDVIGLNLLFVPPEPLIDLIFVHGLWGDYQKTWNATRSPSHFWPKEWLSRDPGFKHVRISSYGYDTAWTDDFNFNKKDNVASQLGRMLFKQIQDSKHISGTGTSPVIMVGHSVGGLMIKEAALQENKEDHKAAKRIRALFFLATPHQNANATALHQRIILACTRPRNLQGTIGTSRGLGQLQVTNETFAELQSEMQLWSFYETRGTELDDTTALVLKKAHAILDVPREKSQEFDSNHANMGKIKEPDDPAYWNIREALVSTIESILQDYKARNKDSIRALGTYLGTDEDTAERDLMELEENRVEGSCEWLLGLSQFDEWQEGLQPHKRFFCLEGIPGAGKSVIATVVIHHFENSNRYCSYFFFRQSDQENSTVSALLRSIAFQMARGNAKIREALIELQQEDPVLKMNDSRAIWQKVYVRCILRAELPQPHYWVIDGLDKCSDYEILITFFAKIDPDFPLRILFTSRPEREIQDLFRPMIEKHHIFWETISTAHSNADIKKFFLANQSQLPRRDLIDDLVEKSFGNFLWATLVLKRLPEADTEKDIQRIIDEVPDGMVDLYNQILQKISREKDSTMTKAILRWTVCTIRPLSVVELKDALDLDIRQSILDLGRTIAKRCGHLIYVDRLEKVQVVHPTVRTFLLNNAEPSVLAIHKSSGHSQLAKTCLSYLVSSELKPPEFPTRPSSSSKVGNKSCFLEYACTAFSGHLVESDTQASTVKRLLKLLSEFLKRNVLSWIEFISRSENLSHLMNAAKHFKIYLDRCKAHDASMVLFCQQALNSWAIDLRHLVAKLGKNMLNHPDAIFFLIPPICPPESSIFRQFGNVPSGLSVKGLSSSGWDERLSSINFSETATAVACSPTRIAVGLETGELILYYTDTYQESGKKSHGGKITLLKFTDTGNLLASSGRDEINIWETNTGQKLCMIPPPYEVISLCFQEDRILRGVTRKNHYLSWEVNEGADIDRVVLYEPDLNERSSSFERQIAKARFSAELNILAVAHRSDPIWLWDLEQRTWLPGACRKHSGHVCAVNDMIFSPDPASNLLVTAYSDGDLVLYNFKSQEQRATAHDVGPQILAVSADGKTLASGNSSSIQIFELETLKLIYVMELADYNFSGLVFSRKSDRLIGIRGDQCNIWGPSVLVRSPTEPTDTVDIPVYAPEKTVTAESSHEYDVITSIVCYPDSQYIFCGRASGAIDLYDTSDAKVVQQICKHDVAIGLLATCSSGILASVCASTHASVHSIRRRSTGTWSVKQQWAKRMAHPIVQIVLSPSGDKLFVVTTKTMILMNNGQGTGTPPDEIMYPGAYWSQSPSSPNQLLAHEYDAIHVLDWDSRREHAPPYVGLSTDFRTQHGQSPRSNRPVLLKLADGLFRLKILTPSQRAHRSHSSGAQDSAKSFSMVSFARESAFDVLGASVELIIGLYRSKLLFLDTDAWICSVVLDDFYQRQYKRHFFLPSDWLSIQTELVISVTAEGDVVVGKGAEVAVFHNGLGYGFFRRLQA